MFIALMYRLHKVRDRVLVNHCAIRYFILLCGCEQILRLLIQVKVFQI